MWSGNASSDDLHAFRIWSTATADDLLARAGKEMQAGAKIVFWSELNALLLREQEAAFIERGAELAAKHHAFLAMAIGVLNDKEYLSLREQAGADTARRANSLAIQQSTPSPGRRSCATGARRWQAARTRYALRKAEFDYLL